MADLKQAKLENISTAELALKCSEFFMSLGEYCLEFYHKHNKEVERKTKMIKKTRKLKAKPQGKEGEDGENNDDEVCKKLPKKPLTAYIIYFQEKKPNFVEKHPGLNLSDLTKLIAKQWKQINDQEKKIYLDQAQQDRKRYEQEIKEFKIKYGTITQEYEDEQLEENDEQFNKNQVKESDMKREDQDEASDGESNDDDEDEDQEEDQMKQNV